MPKSKYDGAKLTKSGKPDKRMKGGNTTQRRNSQNKFLRSDAPPEPDFPVYMPDNLYSDEKSVELAKAIQPRHLSVVHHYLFDGMSLTEAYRKIYPNCGPHASRSCGYNVLMRPEIVAYIDHRRSQMIRALEINQARIMQEYAAIGFANMGDFVQFTSQGDVIFKPSNELSRDQMAAIHEISGNVSEEGGQIKIKLHDKKAALDSLSRILNLFEKDNSRKVDVDGLTELLSAISNRTVGPPSERS